MAQHHNKAILLMEAPACRIIHSQQRPENRGEETVEYQDIDLEALVDAAVIDRLYPGVAAARDWRAFFWDASGNPRAWGIRSIALTHRFDAQSARMWAVGPKGGRHDLITVPQVRVRKFVLTPLSDHDVQIKFQIQAPVTPEFWRWLEPVLPKRACGVEIIEPTEGQAGLLADGGDGADEAGEENEEI